MDQYPKFSEFATDEGKLDGEKVKLKDIFGKEILVTASETLNISNPLRGTSW